LSQATHWTRARRIRAALSGRYIRVSPFASFESTLGAFKEASKLTLSQVSPFASKGVTFAAQGRANQTERKDAREVDAAHSPPAAAGTSMCLDVVTHLR